MPEGPEILLTSQYLSSKIKGRYIASAKIISGRYTHETLKGLELLKQRLKIIKIDCKGKFLWMELKNNENERIYLLNTFGMAGEWSMKQDNNSRLLLVLDNGDKNNKKYKLYFNDFRNFGSIILTKYKNDLRTKLNKLGLDLIKSELSLTDMTTHITGFIDIRNNTKRKTNNNIVNILMAQDINKGIGCGIGNYLCAEILYEAQISPHRDITSLNKNEILNLAKAIRQIMKEAYVNNNTKYMERLSEFMSTHYDKILSNKFPNYYSDIKLQNKQFVFRVYGQQKDLKGNRVTGENIYADRTTWWVPAVQK